MLRWFAAAERGYFPETEKKLIFVSFEPGTRGHYIARVVASLPHVHWYSHPDNGIHPWNINSAKHSTIRQRSVAPFHFDRITDFGKLPPTWDYVDRFFPSESDYYQNVFWPDFDKKAHAIDKILVYCTHSSPDQLLKQFPNAKILSVTESVDTIVHKYTRTAALFPGYIRMKEIVAANNPWLAQLTEWHTQKNDFTLRDIWSQENHGVFYTDDLSTLYENYLRNHYTPKYQNRLLDHPNTLRIRIHPDWSAVRDFLSDET